MCLDNPVATSKWSPSECRAVLEAINYVLYKKLGFHGASGENNEIFDDPKNSFIHTVRYFFHLIYTRNSCNNVFSIDISGFVSQSGHSYNIVHLVCCGSLSTRSHLPER